MSQNYSKSVTTRILTLIQSTSLIQIPPVYSHLFVCMCACIYCDTILSPARVCVYTCIHNLFNINKVLFYIVLYPIFSPLPFPNDKHSSNTFLMAISYYSINYNILFNHSFTVHSGCFQFLTIYK